MSKIGEQKQIMFGFLHITWEWKEVQCWYWHGCLHNVNTYQPEWVRKFQKIYFILKPNPNGPNLGMSQVGVAWSAQVWFRKKNSIFLTYSGLYVLTLWRQRRQYKHCTSFHSQVICKQSNMICFCLPFETRVVNKNPRLFPPPSSWETLHSGVHLRPQVHFLHPTYHPSSLVPPPVSTSWGPLPPGDNARRPLSTLTNPSYPPSSPTPPLSGPSQVLPVHVHLSRLCSKLLACALQPTHVSLPLVVAP